MKKHGLFKILLLVLLVVIVLTYCIKGRGDAISYLGLGDVFLNFLQSFYYFFDTILFILIVGGFYGVLNKTGAYKKLLDKIVTKFKPKSKEFVFAIIILFALITALTGLTIPLLVSGYRRYHGKNNTGTAYRTDWMRA